MGGIWHRGVARAWHLVGQALHQCGRAAELVVGAADE
jgi:hypothetical protein